MRYPTKLKATKRKPLYMRAWWVMREMVVFSLHDLLTTVADGSERTASKNLTAYLRALERSDVITRARHDSWRLKRDLGPAAPCFRVGFRRLLNPNTGQFLDMRDPNE